MRHTSGIMLLAALMLSATTFVRAQTAELEAIASGAFPADEPGAAILVTRGDEVLLRSGYGMADLELGVPLEPDMVFRIGSVTKQFTAAAILLLQERGLLDVGDDIRRHLPEFPTQGRTITIEHLLTHTSGIRSYTDMEAFGEQARNDLSVDEMIAWFENEPLAFEPGEKYAYNNSGYFLLGAIIERVSGSTYEEFLRENVFEPLQMSQSSYGAPRPIVPRRARGYQQSPDGFENAEFLSMRLPYAAGSLLSSVDDLSRWDRALYGNDLLSDASREAWWTPFPLTSGASTHYGYGWSLSSYEGIDVVAHGGGINGFTCYMLRMPSEQLFVAVLTNRAARAPSPALVARRLAAAAVGKPIVEPTPAVIPVAALETRSGVYRVDERARYEVRLEDDTLYLRRYGDEHPDGGRVRDPGPSESLNRRREPLIPLSTEEFAVADSLLRVRFEGDDVLVSVWGREERATRSGPIPSDREAVLQTAQSLFDAMTRGDEDGLRAVLDPGARLVRTGLEGGAPSVSTTTVDDFVTGIVGHDGPTLVEKTWDARVEIADSLASVWMSYALYIGDSLHHCGENALQLARGPLGWRIVALADTERREGCTAPP